MKTNTLTIGIISPSSPLPALFPSRYERGIKSLLDQGYRVVEGGHVKTKRDYTTGTAEERANDINNLFSNEELTMVMATIGGDYSAEILKYINWEQIQKSACSLIGYSDITVLLIALGVKANKVVYYGPTLMTEFSEFPCAISSSTEGFKALFDERDSLVISPVEKLYAKGVDWAKPPQKRELNIPVFSKTIRPGVTTGRVIGGCIESLEHLRGTEYWPDLKDAILLLETSEDGYNRLRWRSLIADYTNMGIFDKINGIVIGQKNWSVDEVNDLSSIFVKATQKREIPILYGLPFGHISPICSFPMFTNGILDATQKILTYKKPFLFVDTRE